MSALDSLKVASNTTIEELTQLEDNARNGVMSHQEERKIIELGGYLEGVRYAIALLESQTCTRCKAVREIALHGICTSCYYGIKGAN